MYIKLICTKTIDYNTFRIVKDSDLGNSGYRLNQLDYNEYVNSVIDQEDEINTTTTSTTHTDSVDTITVASTSGFDSAGTLHIGNEQISYTAIGSSTTFTGCTRGFSGITTYRTVNDPYNLTYTSTTPAEHDSGASIQNLSALFLQEFYTKLKAQYTPGLEGVTLSPTLDVNNFIKEARSLYESKGTDESFKILFKALFGLEPKINDLEQYLIKPSYANYLRRQSFAVRVISGDPLN